MEQFESDVENGEVVDIKDYLKDDTIDYSNSITKMGNKIASGISEVMTKGVSGLLDAFKRTFLVECVIIILKKELLCILK